MGGYRGNRVDMQLRWLETVFFFCLFSVFRTKTT